MTFEKLTYSGNSCNNYLYFSIYADFFDTDRVTNELGLEPTSVMLKREPIPIFTAWNFKIHVSNEIDLEKPLEKLIDLLEPKTEIINRLKRQLNLSTHLSYKIDIDINPDASTPFFGLNTKAIEILSQTDTEVSYDVYKADTNDVFSED